MKILCHGYRHLVRVEIKDLESKETDSVSFIETTFEEVLEHINKNLKLSLSGIKVRITIRENHHIKQWGKSKCYTTYVPSIKIAMYSLTDKLIRNL